MSSEGFLNGLNKYSGLTEREKQILYHANEGLGNKEIGERLYICSGTVKKHLDNIFRKLQVGNKIGALNKIKN